MISEHSEVSINNEVDDLIRCANVETIAEPIDAHFSREHGIEHEVLQVLQGLGLESVLFMCLQYVTTMPICVTLCRLVAQPTQFVLLSSKCVGGILLPLRSILFRIVIITLIHHIIQQCCHSFDVHVINDLLDELILKFGTFMFMGSKRGGSQYF